MARRFLLLALVPALTTTLPASACNPDPPAPPILEGHGYDAVARDYLLEQAGTVAIARYRGRLDFLVQGDSDDQAGQPDYLFELLEGWKNPLPLRLAVPGHWVSCDLRLDIGASFLIYLDGGTPLFILPATSAGEDRQVLGDPDWFYTTSGHLVEPELLEGLGEGSAPEEGDR